jgi:hypothetical protein
VYVSVYSDERGKQIAMDNLRKLQGWVAGWLGDRRAVHWGPMATGCGSLTSLSGLLLDGRASSHPVMVRSGWDEMGWDGMPSWLIAFRRARSAHWKADVAPPAHMAVTVGE